MKLLAIDASTDIASVALKVGEKLFSEEQGSQRTHAQLLLPMIDSLLVQANLQLNALDGIVFGCGPGSFTGLRIACSIAKGLAYAHSLPLIPVSSLGAIAFAARQLSKQKHLPILAVLDARMHEMYWSYFATKEFIAMDKVNPVQEIKLPKGQEVVLAGYGIDLYWDEFPKQVQSQISERLNINPSAAIMIQLAERAAIQPISVAEANPLYVRNQVTQGGSRG